MAYHLQGNQLFGGPDWLDTAKFDIDARLNIARVDELKKAGPRGVHLDDRIFLQTLVAEYFKVAVHNETRNLPVYELTAEGASKLREVKNQGMFRSGPGEFEAEGVPVELLVNELSSQLGRNVIDNTGLKGLYAFSVRWTPAPGEQVRDIQITRREPTITADTPVTAIQPPSSSDLLAAIQEQLGLKVEPKTEPVSVVVIDRAEQPASQPGAVVVPDHAE